MIIDLILDRKDNEQLNNSDDYNAKEFYNGCMRYGKIADEITRAMDSGTEEEVKQALCSYIQEQGYNPEIVEYIKRKKWLI